MNMHLVVVRPFGDYQRAETVTDLVEIQKILDGEHVAKVVRVIAGPEVNPPKDTFPGAAAKHQQAA